VAGRWQGADHDQGTARQSPEPVPDDVPQPPNHPVSVDRPSDCPADDEADPRGAVRLRRAGRCQHMHRERAAGGPPPATDGEREVLAPGQPRGSGKHGMA